MNQVTGRTGSYRRDCIVVSLAVGVIGVTFGVFARGAGFDLAQVAVMSALMFTGASQFAAVGVIDDGGSGGAAVGSALLLAARNTLYGPVVRDVLPSSVPRRLASAHFVIDETAAMAAAQSEEHDSRGAFWFTAITLWLCWNSGSLTGAVIGSVVATPETFGLDAAFPAVLVALLAPHLRNSAGRMAALTAAAIAAVAVPLTPSGVPLLLAAFAVGPALMVRRRHPDSDQQFENPVGVVGDLGEHAVDAMAADGDRDISGGRSDGGERS